MVDKMTKNLILCLSPKAGLLITGLISTTLLSGALFFQYVIGLAPCNLCMWQRWPHVLVMIFSLLGLVGIHPKKMLFLIFSAGIASTSLGIYHAGIEWQLWAGPSSCSLNIDPQDSISNITDQLLNTALMRCDEVPWALFGISMAGWNALISLDIVAASILALRKVVR